MKNSKIEIDLKDFEGKSILELKRAIYNELTKVRVIYSVPRPGDEKRTFEYHPFEMPNLSDSRNDYIIKESQYGDL